MKRKNRVLVTGADGFIGSHLVEHLVKEGYSVKAFCIYNSLGSWGWLDSLPPALKAELERSHTADPARQEDLQALLVRFRQLHWAEDVSSKEAQDALYDDQGLPA